MKSLTLLISILGGSVFGLGAQTPQAEPVDEISQSGIQSAFQILQREYIRKDDLTFDELNRSALHGLLSRLSFGAELIENTKDSKIPPGGLHSELLTPEIAYLRLDSYSAEEVTLVELALRQFSESSVSSLILDLRAKVPLGSFDVAAAILDFFLPRGMVMFKMRKLGQQDADLVLSRSDPLWTRPVIVLVDGETGSVGETIGSVLRQQKRCILVGAPTRGATVRYDVIPVDEKWSLRFAREEMILSDDASVFMKGLKPEFKVDFSPESKGTIFKLSRGSSIKPHVFDEARLRYNEAALVARKHPELDAYIRRSAGKESDDIPHPQRDLVLQRAVDMLLSTQFLEDLKMKSSPPVIEAKKKGSSEATPNTNPANEQ
jgi:hypothetical protein